MVKNIVIYPVKSMGGTQKKSWFATNIGFEYDRNWMLVDKKGKMMTQRTCADLATFAVDVEDGLVFIQKDGEKISWEIAEYSGNIFTTSVWDDTALVREVSQNISKLISEWLHQHVRLVQQAGPEARFHNVASCGEDIPVSLADGYPYLVVGTQSINYLNNKLPTDILWNRFRPNLVVETIDAHEEDQYQKLQIGEALFHNIKPCARCQIINIDQESGKASKEPSKTLANYRKKDFKIFFGTNMTNIKPGLISVGDDLIHND